MSLEYFEPLQLLDIVRSIGTAPDRKFSSYVEHCSQLQFSDGIEDYQYHLLIEIKMPLSWGLPESIAEIFVIQRAFDWTQVNPYAPLSPVEQIDQLYSHLYWKCLPSERRTRSLAFISVSVGGNPDSSTFAPLKEYDHAVWHGRPRDVWCTYHFDRRNQRLMQCVVYT